MNLRERLQSLWTSLVEPLGVKPEVSQPILQQLVAQWSSPTRHYHNLVHLHNVLEFIESQLDLACNPAALRLAGWFHDAIYDTHRNDNERASAALVLECCRQMGLDDALGQEAARLILLTREHKTDDQDIDGHILLDADLAILGATSDRYDAYARAIRQEYAWVSQKQFILGRRNVLYNFIARPRLYYLDRVRQLLDARARLNLQRELATLKTSVPSAD